MADYEMLISAPRPTINIITATHLVALTAPSPTIAITGNNSLSIEVPKPTITFTSHTAVSAALELIAPSPTITMMGGGALYITVPEPRIDLEGGVQWNELNIEAPVPILVISSTYTVGILNIRAPPPDLLILTDNSTKTNLALIAPVPTIAITSHTVATGDLNITAPAPIIDISTGGVVTELAPTVLVAKKVIVLNTDNWEITEYTWQFDQLVKFGDKYLGIDSTGIYLLGGDTNNGELINSTVETGLDDFGITMPKRISNMRVGWKSVEDAILTVIMDDDNYEYDLLATDGHPGTARVKVGTPRLRRHIGLKLTNEKGSDFDLYDIEIILSTWK